MDVAVAPHEVEGLMQLDAALRPTDEPEPEPVSTPATEPPRDQWPARKAEPVLLRSTDV
jgi:hypothetical protein